MLDCLRYRDGVKRGDEAARERKAFNAQLERDYRDATNGYTVSDRGRISKSVMEAYKAAS